MAIVCTNQDIVNMLSSVLQSNETGKWFDGLRFVKLVKVRVFRETIKCTPCDAIFGTPVKVGLKTFSFSNESIEHLIAEEELQGLKETPNKASQRTNSEIDYYDVDNSDLLQNDPPMSSRTVVKFKVLKIIRITVQIHVLK